MFGIEFPELVVIGVVALVVLGPERLPKAARFIGLWVRRARAQWTSVKSELERELAAEEFRRTLHDTEKAMHDIDADVRAADADARREFDAMRKAASDTSSAAPGAAASASTAPTPEPFDPLADFDPNAVEPHIAPPRADAPLHAVPGNTAHDDEPASTAPPPPAATSAFAAAAAALGRHQADAELSAAAVMTGPNPPASSLAHGALAVAADADPAIAPTPAPSPHPPVDAPRARDRDDDARPA